VIGNRGEKAGKEDSEDGMGVDGGRLALVRMARVASADLVGWTG
jgi:hypothetical protein